MGLRPLEGDRGGRAAPGADPDGDDQADGAPAPPLEYNRSRSRLPYEPPPGPRAGPLATVPSRPTDEALFYKALLDSERAAREKEKEEAKAALAVAVAERKPRRRDGLEVSFLAVGAVGWAMFAFQVMRAWLTDEQAYLYERDLYRVVQ